jgi:hypothetical protein
MLDLRGLPLSFTSSGDMLVAALLAASIGNVEIFSSGESQAVWLVEINANRGHLAAHQSTGKHCCCRFADPCCLHNP